MSTSSLLDRRPRRRRTARARRPGEQAGAPVAAPARRPPPAAASACPRGGRRRPACRSTAGSPNAPSTSSRSWNASPSGSAVGRQRALRGRRGGRPARRRGAAAARSCTCPTCSGRCGGRSARSRSPRAVPSRSRYWPTLSSRRSSCHTAAASARDVAEQHVGVDEGEVADEDGDALAEAAGLAPPVAGRRARRRTRRGSVGGAAARVGPVHHVVVDEGEGVEQLEGGAGVDEPGSSGSPPAPTNAQ